MNTSSQMGHTRPWAKSSKPKNQGAAELSEVSETIGRKSPGYMRKAHCLS